MADTYAGVIVTRLGLDLTPLQRGFSQAETMGRSYSSSMTATMTKHTDTASRGFGGMAKSVLAAGAGLGGWVFAAETAAQGAIGLGKALFGSSADMEQTQIAFQGLLGSSKAASDMMKKLQDFAAATPFEFPELAKDSQMLIGMGVAAKDIIPWMTAIGDAAAGVGAGAEGVEQVTRAMGQMQAKGKISGDEMMQLTEAGIPAWKILASSMGLSVAQVQALSQKGQLGQDAINKLVAGMEKMYGGQMANQAKTFNGLLSTLKDNAGMALRAFVGPLFEAAKGGLAKLVEVLGSPAFQNFASGAAKWIGDAMQRIGQFIGPVVDGIGKLFSSFQGGSGTMNTLMPQLQQLAGTVFQSFLTTGKLIADFVQNSLIPAIKNLQPTFSAIGNLFVTTIIPAFLKVLPIFFQVSNVIRQVFLAVLSAALPVIVNIANTIAGWLIPAIKFIAPYIVLAATEVGKFIGQIATLAIPLIKQLGGTLNGIVTFLKNVFIAIWPALGPIVGAAFQMVVNVIKIAWSIISGIIKIALNLLKGDWGAAWNSLKDMLGGIWDGIKGIIGAALQVIIGILAGIGGAIVGIFQAIWNKAKEIWGGIWGAISGFMSAIWNTIVSVWTNIWNAITGFMGRIWHAIIDPWQPVISFIGDVMRIIGGIISLGWSVIWGTISSALTNIWNIIVSVWNTITSFIGSILSRIWGVIVSVWNTISGFIGNIITTIWNTEVRGWTNIWNAISGFLSRIWGTITTVWNTIRNFIGSVLSAIGRNISNAWNSFWGTISRFVGLIWNGVTSTFNRLRDTVGGIFRGMINNIIDWLNPGLNAVSNFINFFIDGINRVSQFFIKKDLITWRAHLGPIGHLAQGTQDWKGGLAVVGERGREMVYLPAHSKVVPNEETEILMRTGKAPIPHFAEGLGMEGVGFGIGGGVGDILGAVIGAITGGISGLVNSILKNIFAGAPGLGVFANLAGGILGKVAGFLADWVKNNVGSLLSPTGQAGTLPMQQIGNFILPPGGGYGQQYWYGRHQGMDFQFGQGTPVREVVGGVVAPGTGWYDWGGELDVWINGINGMMERYLHLSALYVRVGQMLSRGQLVGLSGGGTPASGLGYWSTGSHLHMQYDWGTYSSSVNPLAVWASLGIFKPFRRGGIIREPIIGMGMRTHSGYSFGEGGAEAVVPLGAGGMGGGGGTNARVLDILERLERALVSPAPISEYQIIQALGKLLANGVR